MTETLSQQDIDAIQAKKQDHHQQVVALAHGMLNGIGSGIFQQPEDVFNEYSHLDSKTLLVIFHYISEELSLLTRTQREETFEGLALNMMYVWLKSEWRPKNVSTNVYS